MSAWSEFKEGAREGFTTLLNPKRLVSEGTTLFAYGAVFVVSFTIAPAPELTALDMAYIFAIAGGVIASLGVAIAWWRR